MAATTAHRTRSLPSAALRALWAARTWRATSHLITGAVTGLVGCVAVLVLLALAVTLAPSVLPAVGAVWLLLILNRALASLHRSRYAALLGTQIPRPASPGDTGSGVRRPLRELRRAATLRQLGYHLLIGLFGPVAGAAVVATWSAGMVLAVSIFHAGREGLSPEFSTMLTATGLVLLLLAPWLAYGLAKVDVALARRLLGISRTEELAHQVASLSASREGAVDADDAGRRRIERDLHDGTQQRLTSLALNLGVVRTALGDLPAPAREAIASAHEEAKLALSELRDLVRGMHPAALDELGLDAALSGIAARSPVPVRLRVAVPVRPAPTVEATAYFVVSEALTNIAKHAEASHVDVTLTKDGDRLRVEVADDGCGGADPDGGTGLRGLANRVRSVDGTLHLNSPAGGPTTLVAELPCAW